MGFEPTIPEFERAKTVHALCRAATVIGTAEVQVTADCRKYGSRPSYSEGLHPDGTLLLLYD
jgi:hypothetical protein